MKRLFLALEVDAPWPDLPGGRLLDAGSRHLTLAFLGNVEPPTMEGFPLPPFEIGPVGQFDKLLQLRNVIAWHVDWFGDHPLGSYPDQLCDWLGLEKPDFLPHVTLARKPFDRDKWEQHFTPLPLMVTGLHLYESLGRLGYEPIWTHPVAPPFEELEHTADIAFRVWGKDLQQLHLHAQTALAFKSPRLLDIFPKPPPHTSLDDVIIDLNQLITEADTLWGSPFKAVSFSGDATPRDGILEWEMIVDI